MGDNKYNDRILLKLHRQYSKDETVKLQKEKIDSLKKELQDSEIEKGKLKSYTHELEDKIKVLDDQLDEEIQQNQSLRKTQSDFDKKLNNLTDKLKKKVKDAKKEEKYWREKFLNLQAKTKKDV